MKTAFRKNVFRQIKNTWNRFIAIFGIVALGVGFFAGLKATTPVMKMSADAYYDDCGFMDLRILSTMGLTQEDVDAIQNTEGIEELYASYSTDALVDFESGQRAIKVMSYSDSTSINRPTLVEGRLPENDSECVVDSRMVDTQISIGCVIRISDENTEDVKQTFARQDYTVVGRVSSPLYYSIDRGSTTLADGSLDGFIYIDAENFTTDYYTEVYALVSGASSLMCYDDAYDDFIAETKSRVESLAPERQQARYDEIYHEAKQQIDEAQATLDEKRAQADAELAQAEEQLQSGQQQIDDGYAALEQSRLEWESGKRELEQKQQQAQEQFAQAQAQLQQSQAQYDQSVAQYQELVISAQQAQSAAEELKAQIDALTEAGDMEAVEALTPQYEQAVVTAQTLQQTVTATEQSLAQAQQQLEQGKQELQQQQTAAQQQIDAAAAQLEQGQQQIKSGQQELDQSQQELSQGWAEYEQQKADALEQLAQGQAEIDENAQKLQDIEMPEWYVLDRNANVGYAGFVGDSEKIDAVAAVFPVFFFLVAALVCLTTMTRMVEEQRTQIGVLKSLGYKKSSIAFKYLVYANSACISGSLFGLCVGYIVFPAVIMKTYRMLYTEIPLQLDFNIEYALISSIAAIVCISAATIWACVRELSEVPAELIRPKAPAKGKKVFLERIRPLWKRLSFTQKVTARNLIRYKKRFFMTVIGIGGCTALLLTGFGLSDSINGIVGKQFEDLQSTDLMLSIKSQASVDDASLNQFLTTEMSESVYIRQTTVDAVCGNETFSVYLVVPEDADKMNDFMTFRHRVGGESVTFPNADGVLVTEKMASKLGLEKGDTFTLKSGDEEGVEVSVGDICENYVYNYVYMSADAYTACFGSEPEYNMVWGKYLSDLTPQQEEDLCQRALQLDQVEGVTSLSQTQDSVSDMLQGLNAVVVLIVICASALAFIVLYNLTNINITERIREIATIKVLGFRDKEVNAYVYRENVVLTVIGMVVGLVLGVFLHAFVIVTAEVDMVMFVRTISPWSYVFAALLTLLFAGFVSFVTYFSLKKVDMIESLKSVE